MRDCSDRNVHIILHKINKSSLFLSCSFKHICNFVNVVRLDNNSMCHCSFNENTERRYVGLFYPTRVGFFYSYRSVHPTQ